MRAARCGDLFIWWLKIGRGESAMAAPLWFQFGRTYRCNFKMLGNEKQICKTNPNRDDHLDEAELVTTGNPQQICDLASAAVRRSAERLFSTTEASVNENQRGLSGAAETSPQ